MNQPLEDLLELTGHTMVFGIFPATRGPKTGSSMQHAVLQELSKSE